jgi:hypothetical protein
MTWSSASKSNICTAALLQDGCMLLRQACQLLLLAYALSRCEPECNMQLQRHSIACVLQQHGACFCCCCSPSEALQHFVL